MLTYLNQSSNLSNLENVGILNRVRLIAICGQLALILFSIWYLEIKLPVFWLSSLLIIEVLFEVYCYRLLVNQQNITSFELFFHIVFDSTLLACLVYFSGGANNPFIYLLLLFVALGSFMLAPHYLLMVVVVQLIFYSLLNIYQHPLTLDSSSPLASFHLHLTGMWVNFVLTAILIAIFGLLTRRTLLRQEKELQLMREKHLQDEQILGLGIMSAGAAHELGTPLSTMAIIVDDLKHSELPKEIQEDLHLIENQIIRCSDIIASLNDKSLHAKQQLAKMDQTGDSFIKDDLQQQLNTIVSNWLVYRPQVKAEQKNMINFADVKQIISISVEQAITSLLDNAADASLANNSDKIEMNVYCKSNNNIIEILDFGLGLLPEMKKSLGVRIQESKKKNGLGWGVFLSNVSIERAGGSVELIKAASGGTLTRIVLPQRLE